MQNKIKRSALADGGLSPNSTSVLANNALRRRQAYASSGILSIGMKALKDTKQLVRVLHIEACTVVPHEIGQL